MPTKPAPPTPLQLGQYVWFRPFSTHREPRPGRITALPDPGQGEWARVRWLDEDSEYTVPLHALTRADPDPDALAIEDDEGAPVPAELQRGGQLWMAVLDGLRSGLLGHRASIWSAPDLHATADWVMVRLAPLLWPLLPSNPDSATASVDRDWAEHVAEQQADAAAGDDTPDDIAARTGPAVPGMRWIDYPEEPTP